MMDEDGFLAPAGLCANKFWPKNLGSLFLKFGILILNYSERGGGELNDIG